jgi:ATP-dependent DNA helicase RecQ
LDRGYLEKDGNGILKLNRQSEKILFGKQRAAMRRGLRKRGDITGEDLFQALQKLRYEISAKEYVAASALFSDGVLRDLCRILPKDKKQLAAVDGMGIYKANRYGDQILRVIRLFVRDS